MSARDRYKPVTGRTSAMWPDKETVQVGDFIEGRFVKLKENVGRNQSNVYVLRTAKGEEIGVWGSTVLDSKFQDVPLGSMVCIEYLGLATGKSGSAYKDYFVGIDHTAPAEAVSPDPVNPLSDDDIPF